MARFTWIPFYKELAKKLLEYKDRQKELIDFLEELHDQKGLKIIPLRDFDHDGNEIRLDEIDLFTFFATFNRGIKDETRSKLLAEIKTRFNLTSELPTDFSGIPVFNNQKSWLFAYTKDRQAEDIQLLWQIAENAIANPDHLAPELFNKCLNIRNVGATYLTVGIFWLNPDKFVACDKIITQYLIKRGFKYPKVKDFQGYAEYRTNLINFVPGTPFYELSYNAWKESMEQQKRPVDITSENKLSYWLYSPGEKAELWEEFHSNGIMALGWDELGDLNGYPDKSSIVTKLQELNETIRSKKNDSTANFEFYKIMAKGDIVIAKKGRTELIGYGIVKSDYFYDEKREKYQHCRQIDWKEKGVWPLDHKLAVKTLTNITNYDSEHPNYTRYHERLMAVLENRYIVNGVGEYQELKYPSNEILYGPPGTGKTYNTINHAVAIIENKSLDTIEVQSKANRKDVLDRFREYKEAGQIIFTTFHQSMCYEDFIEGIKPLEPENEGDSDGGNNIVYKVIDGIFKQLCIHASFEFYLEQELKQKSEPELILFDDRWNQLINDFENNGLNHVESLSGKKLQIKSVTQQGNLIVKPEGLDALDYIVSHNRAKKLFDAIPDLSAVKNIDKEFRQVIGGSNSTAYWSVLNYLKTIKLRKEQKTVSKDEKSYSYEQKKELLTGWKNRVFNRKEVKPYVIIIDEINRGNVAQIFGELITLTETDKRLGGKEELTLTLPYSKQSGFGVPSNLYIIGTMNTADRSVETLDTALRRRFSFTEVPPSLDILRACSPLKDVAEDDFILSNALDRLVELMSVINNRIEKLLDKDHMIGHSYFLSVETLHDLKLLFKNKIIPLLQEYFYGDMAKIGLVLGEAFFETQEDSNQSIFARFSHDAIDDLNDRRVFRLKQAWKDDQEFIAALKALISPNV